MQEQKDTALQNQSTADARQKAKGAGAEVVKQWDSTLDNSTRKCHQKLDGQIRELDEPFEVNGHKAQFPGGLESQKRYKLSLRHLAACKMGFR